MKTVFFDVDTQLDFLYPAGALHVPGAEFLVPAIARLNRFAAEHRIPLISTADAHTENDPEFANWPPHCISGTTGQHKAERTLLEKRVVIPNRPSDVSIDGAQQIVVEKQTTDVFLTRTIRPLLDCLAAGRFVVYGVVTEVCVLFAARGLLKAGKHVTVVTDAVQTLKSEDSAQALAEVCAAGGALATVAQVLEG
ncbi:MAG TPA: isochorismatase family cysteine hydrolase [Bryobacteraceae bacterium]|nr:isochorismatase family cysteine hydrolase [Bryobacteraceae bacterium]